jgi:hypothetical protein
VKRDQDQTPSSADDSDDALSKKEGHAGNEKKCRPKRSALRKVRDCDEWNKPSSCGSVDY